ncbi:hypothetical protein [uncultured Deinococcus sp.]|uniref:hypothetical protein n=1 Tax=uncultured Deinococcus sp. TaxID=158789 RepID=UPI0025CBF668|nr:hypothetical protein [uncultured Deinococcus sp.]
MRHAWTLPVISPRRLAKPALILTAALLGGAGSHAQTPVPATVYIPENWCQGGYCSSSASVTLQSSLEQAFLDSRSVQVVRKAPSRGLQLSGGITSVSNGGSLCLPIVGCLSGKTLRATIELTEAGNGAVLWRDTCEGTSGGFTSWRWGGYLQINSDEDKAAADCAGKLAQKFMTSPTYLSYLSTLNAPAAAAPAPAGTAPLAQGGGSGGPATPVTPTVATVSQSWFYGVVFPDEATRQQACAEGYSSASKGASATPPGKIQMGSTEGTVTITTSYGAIFLSCLDAGSKLQPKPESVPQLDTYIVVEHKNRPDRDGLAAAIAFYDANDRELGRIALYTKGQYAEGHSGENGRYPYCSTTCTAVLTPDQLSGDERAWISQSSYVKILANMGKGAEAFTLTKEKYPQLR